MLVVEEPEAHLHPLAQEWLALKLKELAGTGLQVVLTTHSPAFVDLMNIDGLAVVSKDSSGATNVAQHNALGLAAYCERTGGRSSTADGVQTFYRVGSTSDMLSGFFARQVILVEGPNEALALPLYLGAVGFDCTRQGAAVLSVGGKRALAKWWRLFTFFERPTYVIFDNDDHGEDQDASGRKDVLGAMGIDPEEIAEAVTADEFRAAADYAVFGGDFESTLRQRISSYASLDDEARTTYDLSGKGNKPLRARYIAERVVLREEPRAQRLFEELAARLRVRTRAPVQT